MELSYNGFNLHDLGEVTIVQSREFEGDLAPQRARVTLRVRVDVFARSYADNRDLLDQARAALRTTQGVLRWRNAAVGVDYVNQTAALQTEDLPEEWGEYHQTLNLTFAYHEALDPQGLVLTVHDGTAPIQFTRVSRWEEQGAVERFDPKRRHRRETQLTVSVSGFIEADTTDTLANRQAALAAQAAAYRQQMNTAEVTVTFGSLFSGTVRIGGFQAAYSQQADALEISFTGTHTLTPDESGYATCLATAAESDNQSGEVRLSLSGTVQAEGETSARAKMTAVVAALASSYGYTAAGRSQLLQWDATPNQISANADGDTFTELAFSVSYRRWKTSNATATFTRTGGSTAVSLGHVRLWATDYSAARFHESRSQRRRASGRVEASGTWAVPDPAAALATRRAALLAQQQALAAEVNHADGTLAYGSWSQVVRVESLKCEINQAETGVDWSFSAGYSQFPDENGYATAEFTASVRDQAEELDSVLSFTGRLFAPNGSLARAQLATLRTQVLGLYGFAAGDLVRTDTGAGGAQSLTGTTAEVSAGIAEGLEAAETGTKTGVTFIELSFSEEYRRRSTAAQVAYTYSKQTQEDVTTQLVGTTYSGSVTATAATQAQAETSALATAAELGADKAPAGGWQRSQTLTVEYRKTPTRAEDCVRVQFSYEYQSKLAADQTYTEVNAATTHDVYGDSTTTVSGTVAAVDHATAQAAYLAIKAEFAGAGLLRNEQVSLTRASRQTGVAGEDPVFTTQELRLEFSFTLLVAKTSSSARYALSVTQNWLSLEKTTSLRGVVQAASRAAADTLVDTLTGGSYGNLLRDARTESREYQDGATFVSLEFENEYADALTGVSSIREARVTEEVRYSGVRWVTQNLPYDTWDEVGGTGTGGVPLVQPCGQEAGGRTVRGSVTAASLSAARAWAVQHRGLLTGTHPQPEVIETDYEFVPAGDAVAVDGLGGAGTLANVRLYRVTFTFAEILPTITPL